MSIISAFTRRLSILLVPATTRPDHPDGFSLRDWADLPAYHPKYDRTPR